VVGLPGNPVSTFTSFAIFVAPVVRRMMGHGRVENLEVRAILGGRLKRRPGRTTYHLARLEGRDGTLVARPVPTMGSGDVVSLVRSNAFIVTEGAPDALEAGAHVTAVPWRDFHLR
jgi:molybdopterin molybdotransferase